LLLRWSGDGRWLFFAIDPQGSASIAADGLMLQVVSAAGGRPHRIGMALTYSDYMTWCNRKLVFTGGGNRLATTNKQLLAAAPPDWHPRALVTRPNRAWGSVACVPGKNAVVAQSQPDREDYNFSATRWQLWQVAMNGATTQLTAPPAHFSDDSPRFSRDGRSLFFVRSRRGVGSLFALRGRHLTGPLFQVGYTLGYYGHRSWWLDTRYL